jgi:hypothetical protein
MAIKFATTVQGDTLFVKASGFDENPEEVQQYGLALIAECQLHGVTRVLCDERELEYRLNTFDTYEAAVVVADRAPRVARAAIVCQPRLFKEALGWETYAVNRGLTVRVFDDLDEARSWLA